MNLPAPVPPSLILDTNIVLDWLVFRNTEFASLEAAIHSAEVRWLATGAMRQELEYVLAGRRFDRWAPDLPALWSAWDRHCIEVPPPAAGSSVGRPRCTDPDDQKFIDLAIAESARWLVSRDRAVLKVARRLRPFGVEVVVPLHWRPAAPQASPAASDRP
jgi:predicted nucleic acid-binding protein